LMMMMMIIWREVGLTNIFAFIHFQLFDIHFYEDTGMEIQNGCGQNNWGLVPGRDRNICPPQRLWSYAASVVGKTWMRRWWPINLSLWNLTCIQLPLT
jgi:hypothetical protein